MKNVFLQFLTLVCIFFALWFLLSRVEWTTVFKVEQRSGKIEKKLGDMFWDLIKNSEKEVDSTGITAPIDTLVTRICRKNKIDRSKIKLHIIQKDAVNAFALPDNHLIVYTGLITACENEDELCGVLGHEIAHTEKHHVMKKLTNEIGLSALIAITTGNGNSQIIKQVAKLLSSAAYDRSLESEADLASVDYLLKAGIDPEPFANFLFRLSKEDGNVPGQYYWISDHPHSEERATAIIEYLKGKTAIKGQVLTLNEWNTLKEKVKENFTTTHQN